MLNNKVSLVAGAVLLIAGAVILVVVVATVTETIESAFIVISAISTTVIAIFAWRSWKIFSQQHKMYHDPDLRVYPLSQSQKGGYPGYGVILVNPGRVPITITKIKEPLPGKLQWLFMSPPAERPPRIYMQSLPWVIVGGDFAICLRYTENENVKGLKKRASVKFIYYVDKKSKKVSAGISIVGSGVVRAPGGF